MSLATDSIFVTALQSSQELMDKLKAYVDKDGSIKEDDVPRLYGTAIGLPDEDVDNVPVPYVIVVFDSLTNNQGTKDDCYESSYDKVEIAVIVVERTLNDLHELTQMVRDTILSYMRTTTTPVQDYTFTAGQIVYNADKPCYWQELNYQCDVKNSNDDEQT